MEVANAPPPTIRLSHSSPNCLFKPCDSHVHILPPLVLTEDHEEHAVVADFELVSLDGRGDASTDTGSVKCPRGVALRGGEVAEVVAARNITFIIARIILSRGAIVLWTPVFHIPAIQWLWRYGFYLQHFGQEFGLF
uniref:Uncharacterized protein n=1 Tax=Steinernema glaseri TaxID=37863 RepID=A0A1I7ZYS9_9BILA